MIQDFASYPDWMAPGQDSALVLWPDPRQILDDTQNNHHRLGAERSVRIQGLPLAELRRRQRKLLNLSDERPVIATGHQTELFHPGVWAKLAMVGAAAEKIGAQALLAAVDTDAPKHLRLRWPGASRPITDDPHFGTAQWSGLLAGPTPGYLQNLTASLNAAAAEWSFKPMALEFLDYLRAPMPRQPMLSAAIIEAMGKLDASLGLRHRAILMSPVWMDEPYMILAHHLLANAGTFAFAYNQALRDYRTAHGIGAPGWPMPDLQLFEQSCEAPFWIDDLSSQTRRRAGVERDGTEWKLSIKDDVFPLRRDADASAAVELRDFLRRNGVRLSPRALTLTMFLRLLVVDQFVHGIGGGRYDQVNDRVIHQFFGMDPPAFSVTTATLYFPTAAGKPRACLPCLAHEGHRLRHRVIGQEKMELVHQIQSLPRQSIQRQLLFSQMRNRLNAAAQTHPSIKQWEQRFAKAARQNAEEQRLFDRELFYAIQPRERLVGLIEQYASRFANM